MLWLLAQSAVLGTEAQCTSSNDAADVAGLDSTRFDVARAWADRFVESGRLAGLVVAVQRDDDLFIHASGAYETDSIFRICSMSKAITAVAAASLIEDGLLPWVVERVLSGFTEENPIRIPLKPKADDASAAAPAAAPAAA